MFINQSVEVSTRLPTRRSDNVQYRVFMGRGIPPIPRVGQDVGVSVI